MKGQLFAIIFLAIVHCATGQDCEALFTEAFSKIKSIRQQSDVGVSMKYSVSVLSASGEQYTDVIHLEMVQKRFKMRSNDFTIFRDDKTMVVIRPEAKTIFMSKSPQSLQKNSMQAFVSLQDSVIKRFILKSCIQVTDKSIANGSPCEKIEFKLPAKIQSVAGMEKIIYWIDEASVQIQKVQIQYDKNSGQPMAQLSFEFKEIDYNYKIAPFEGSALSKVMDGSHKMRQQYKDYELVDVRQSR